MSLIILSYNYLYKLYCMVNVQFISVAQSCLTLCDPMDCSTPGLPGYHQLPEFTQTHVHWVGDAIQPSHPLPSPSPAFNLSQHQGLFQWVSYFFFNIYFFMWTILKIFIEFVTVLFLFYDLLFWPRGMWDLSSPTRDQTNTPWFGKQS